MYASIQYYDQSTVPSDVVIRTGRRLATSLQRLPGFVVYLLLDAGDGMLLGVSLFEEEAGLLAAEQVLALGDEPGAERVLPSATPLRVTRGELLVQAGL